MANFFCPEKRQFASHFATFGKNIGFEPIGTTFTFTFKPLRGGFKIEFTKKSVSKITQNGLKRNFFCLFFRLP